MSKAWLLAICVACAASAGCGDDDCTVLCEKNAECDPQAPSTDACVDLCNQLSEDEAYADAVADQADCYDGTSCSQIQSGQCTVEP